MTSSQSLAESKSSILLTVFRITNGIDNTRAKIGNVAVGRKHERKLFDISFYLSQASQF